jgi:arylsulfatase A-like enzyme
MAAVTSRGRPSLAALALALVACTGGATSTPAPSNTSSPDSPVPRGPRVVRRLLDELATCEVDHRGLLLDLGSPMAEGRVRAIGDGALAPVEREGTSVVEVTGKGFDVSFVAAEPSPLFVELRLEPESAKGVSFLLDDAPLGTSRWKKRGPMTVTSATTSAPLDPGEHVLGVRFLGGDGPGKTRAFVDWLRLGTPDELRATYGPPLYGDLVTPAAALGKVPHRALSLRTPSLVRCPILVPPSATLQVATGMLGSAKASIEIAVRTDGGSAIVLDQHEVQGGDGAAWSDRKVGLDAFAGQLVQLELRAPAGSTTGRALFADPEIVVSAPAPESSVEAPNVVVVVLSGVERSALPGYGPDGAERMPRLARFAKNAVIYGNHRASTTVVPGQVATLLTGLAPLAHGLSDYGARLGATTPTLLATARSSNVQTALFSAVPHTFEPSGLHEGAYRHGSSSPVSGEAVDPLDEITSWLRDTIARDPSARTLAVVHARGGHPPWLIPPKQLDAMPPANYTGEFQPRRVAQQLGALRRRKGGADLSDLDRARLEAMANFGLAAQDRALGGLFDWLETSGLADRALVVVTGDVSSGVSTLFSDDPPLDEAALALPLYVRFPGGAHAGQRVARATQASDVAATLASALRLPLPELTRASGLLSPLLDPSHVEVPRLAVSGDQRSLRLGGLVLRAQLGARASLCDLGLDPSCAFDRRPRLPYAAQALERLLAALEGEARASRAERQAATFDDATLAALRVWGSME